MSGRQVARILVVCFVVAVVKFPGLTAQEASRFYVVVFNKGPAFPAGNGTEGLPGMEKHIEFILGLHAEGVVPLAGPLFDDDERKRVSGMLYFVRADSVEEAREIAMREPMVWTGVVDLASVREFLIGVGAGRLD